MKIECCFACLESEGPCCQGPVEVRKALTLYHFDRTKPGMDPNADFYACDSHFQEYKDYWEDRWIEYHKGII